MFLLFKNELLLYDQYAPSQIDNFCKLKFEFATWSYLNACRWQQHELNGQKRRTDDKKFAFLSQNDLEWKISRYFINFYNAKYLC